MGGSNGGLLVGAALTQRPDLFRAAVSQVPLLDMLRYPLFRIARLWIPEYGDPEDPEAFAWLHAYSPYHHVVDGTAYGAVLFTAGESDSRVDPDARAQDDGAPSSGHLVGHGRSCSARRPGPATARASRSRSSSSNGRMSGASSAPSFGPPRANISPWSWPSSPFSPPPPVRSFGDERLLLDRRLETLRRILPDGPTPQADVAVVRELAEQSRLARIEASSRPPLEVGPRGETPVELQALGRFADVDRFFRQVALSTTGCSTWRASPSRATQEDVVKLGAVIRLPFRPPSAPLPAPPDGTRARVPGVPKAQADAFVRDQALALAKAEQVAQLRRVRRNPRLFLAEIAAITRDRPVVLSYASWSDTFTIRGLTVGEGPARALESRFEKGFFRVSEFLMARQAACRRFEVKGQCGVAGIEADLPIPTEDPFEQDETPCRIDRDEPRAPSR